MSLLFIDIETYSEVNLKGSNVYAYSAHPSFTILMAAWSVDGGKVNLAIGENEVRAIPGLFDDSVTKVAHNAAFERVCFSRLAGRDEADLIDPEQYIDTMALGATWGYPKSLAAMATALGADPKDEAGSHLIRKFCVPRKDGSRATASDYPEDWERFKAYCVQDVYTLIDIYDRLIEVHGGYPTEAERRLWVASERINDTGIQVDVDLAECAVEAAADNQRSQLRELKEITGLDNPNSTTQLRDWLEQQGHPLENLQKATVQAALETSTGDVHRALELRQELALVTSKKYQAALSHVSGDGRLRGSFKYFGGHTGRYSGSGVQLQNLSNQGLEVSEIEPNILDLKLGYGATADTLKKLVRNMFVGPFTVCDYSAIEARVLAWLAGEQWVIDAFASGRDIYIETAARMLDLDYEEARPHRKYGKVATLALGYGSGIGGLRAFGAQGSDQELQDMVNKWRGASPNIVSFWGDLETAFRKGKGEAAGVTVTRHHHHDRHIVLPSGRPVVYRRAGQRRVMKFGREVREITFHSPRSNAREGTYGGRLVENVTQAVARDLLGNGLLNLTDAGHKVVAHVHDEVLVERTEAATVEAVAAAMCDLPAWAAGLPLTAEGYYCDRYRKE